jgi:hypothetical protein
MDSTEIEDGEEELEDGPEVVGDIARRSLSERSVEEVQQTKDRLRVASSVSRPSRENPGLTSFAFPSREACSRMTAGYNVLAGIFFAAVERR